MTPQERDSLKPSATVKGAVGDAEVEIWRETAAARLRTRVIGPDVREERASWADSFRNELTNPSGICINRLERNGKSDSSLISRQ